MNDQNNNLPPDDLPPEDQPNGGDENTGDEAGGEQDSGQTQRIRQQHVSARVPEDVARGVFSTGAIVLNGPHEFIVDFLQTMTRPHQVASRVVMPPSVIPGFINALKQNIEKFTNRFGEPRELPKPPADAPKPSIEDIYDQLKLPDEDLSGTYANAVMISHSATEFCLDFITSFYPKSAVACRIFLSAPQGPRVLETLSRSWDQYQKKVQQMRRKQQGEAPPGSPYYEPPPPRDQQDETPPPDDDEDAGPNEPPGPLPPGIN